MKALSSSFLPGFRLIRAGLALLTVASLLAGCATQKQVREIVGQSDLATVSAAAGLNPTQPGAADWREASAKIEAFIAAHPDNPVTIAALRVRQAVMLLHHQQLQLAQAAFSEAPMDQLKTARDRALKRLEQPLVWYYGAADRDWTDADLEAARKALTELEARWNELDATTDGGMRDFLAGLRAMVGVKLAANTSGADPARAQLESALNTYTGMLPPGETQRWSTEPWPPANLQRSDPAPVEIRRRFEAEAIIEAARAAMQQNQIPPPAGVTNAWLRGRLAL